MAAHQPPHPGDHPGVVDLLRAALTGRPGAEHDLLRGLRPVVRRYCRRRLGSLPERWADCDDITQEVLTAVHRLLPTYTGQPDAFVPLVYRIAANKVSDHFRRVRRERDSPSAEPPETMSTEPGPAESLCARETQWELGRLLAELPARQSEILRMRLVEGMSARDTGAAVGRSPEAVRVAQHRALVVLRGRLSHQDTTAVRPLRYDDRAQRG